MSTDADTSFLRLQQTNQHLDECRLTTSVRSQQTDDFSFRQYQIQVLKYSFGDPVSFLHTGYFY